MSIRVLTGLTSLTDTHRGTVGPRLAPLYWLIVVIGMLGVILGLYGATTLTSLEELGKVSVSGIGHEAYARLVVGGLLLSAIGVLGLWRDLASRK